MSTQIKPPKLQPNLFDDNFGERVAVFAQKRGMRALKPHEIKHLNELGETVCMSTLPVVKKIVSTVGIIEQYHKATP